MEIKETTTRMTEIDFFDGIFAALTLRNYTTVLFNQALEEAIDTIFQEFKDCAEQRGFDLRFRIRLHPVHGDSETIHRGILRAAQMGIISLDSPGNRIIRIRLTQDMANAILSNLAAGTLFIELTDRIIDILSQ